MRTLTKADLSQHLTLAEVTRSEKARIMGIRNVPDAVTLERLRMVVGAIFEPIRTHFGGPVFVSSGFRCKELDTAINKRVTTSQHIRGEALDLDNDDLIARKVKGAPTNAQVFHFIRLVLPFDQLIWEYGDDKSPGWVHVSFNTDGAGRRKILRCTADAKGQPLYSEWKP